MQTNGRALNLVQLAAELATAGVVVPALGQDGDTLHTYNAQGEPVDLPAKAQAVVAAHVPTSPPAEPDVLADLAAAIAAVPDTGTAADLKRAMLPVLQARRGPPPR